MSSNNSHEYSFSLKIPGNMYTKLCSISEENGISKGELISLALNQLVDMTKCYFCKENIPRYSKFCPHCGKPILDDKNLLMIAKIVGEQKAHESGFSVGLDENKIFHSYIPKLNTNNETTEYIIDHFINMPNGCKFMEQTATPIIVTTDDISNYIEKCNNFVDFKLKL